MSIVKFKVDNWSEKPARIEYAKQTACFYILGNGRRDSISSLYHRFFDTEDDAIGFIEQRKANRVRGREIDRIRKHAVELLESLEEVMKHYPFPDSVIASNAKYVIAKAKGEA